MERKRRVAVTGECMIELLPVLSHNGEKLFRQGFSGDTLNTAVYLSRLGGVETSYITALGTDIMSEAMLADWKKEGIDCSLVRRISGAFPGLYMIQVDEKENVPFNTGAPLLPHDSATREAKPEFFWKS